jgi:phosphocarrier protein HPr
MISKEVVINNKTGLHARPASLLVKKAQNFTSTISLIFKEKEVNAKSLMSILSLGITQGSTLTIQATGNDEEEALTHLEDFFLKELN